MGNSTSFDASQKIKKSGNSKGYFYHLARDVYYDEYGEHLNHSNENIDNTRTAQNKTFVNSKDGFKEAEHIDEFEDYLNERLGTVKNTLRKDAVVMRPLIFQLDPEYTKGASKDEIEKYTGVMLDWAIDTFGEKNIVGFSLHYDEGLDEENNNPHLHVAFTPVTADGRLAQKDWFSNPTKLRGMHLDLRERLRESGYDATYDNVSGGRKRLTDSEYRASKDLEAREDALHDDKRELVRKENRLYKRETELDKREAKVAAKEKQVDANIVKSEEVLNKATLEGEEIISKAELEAKEIRTGAEDLATRTKRVTQQGEELHNKRRLPKGFDF